MSLDALGAFFHSGWFKLITTLFTIGMVILILWFVYFLMRDKLIQRLEYSRSFTDVGAYEGEKATLVETIYNNNFLPLMFINVEGFVYNELQLDEYEPDPKKAMQYFLSRFIFLWPFMQVKRRHPITCKKRGYYNLESVELYYNKRVRCIECQAEYFVYPKLIPIMELALPSSNLQGDIISRKMLISDPFSLSGVREYRPGDTFNMINFKATARSGRLDYAGIRVNNRDFCSNRTLMVYMNFQTNAENTIPTPEYENMMEYGLSYSAALIREAAYNGYKAGFAANCVIVTGELMVRFPLESGEMHLRDILKEMAKVRPRAGVSIQSLLELDVKDNVCDTEMYLLTQYMDDEIALQINALENHNNHVTVIMLIDDERRKENERRRLAEKERLKAEKLARRAAAKSRIKEPWNPFKVKYKKEAPKMKAKKG